MATTQKKTTAKKPAPKKAGSGKQRVKTPPYNHALRLTVGVVFLLLALCVLVTYFGVDATVLAFLTKVLTGLFGWNIFSGYFTFLDPMLSGIMTFGFAVAAIFELGNFFKALKENKEEKK